MIKDIETEAVRYLFQSEPETTFCTAAIIKTLRLRGKFLKRLPRLLREMVKSGELVEKRRGYYRAGQGAGVMSGTLKLTRSGAGIVTNEEGKTVFIESRDIGRAIPGDVVQVRYRPGDRTDPVGVIQQIETESVRDIVGTLYAAGAKFAVTPLNPVYRSDIMVATCGKAHPGDRVVVRVKRAEEDASRLSGEIIEVIGPADKPSLDTIAVMKQYELPETFPSAVMSEAESVEQLLHQPGEHREDLRDAFIITIDPATARDFDDAISLRIDEQGNRELGVHIADVSHFVRPGSKLDKEAFKRGTSVYLIDRVVPMLPEQLSNGVCSLQPNVDRLAFSVFITYDANGHALKHRFAQSIIRSSQRLSYEEAFALLQDKPVDIADLNPKTQPLLKQTLALTRQLKALREQNNALELASTEVEIELAPDGRMTGIHTASNDESHQLIECCMVAANEAVAQEMLTHKIRIISRLHEAPDEEKIAKLINDLKSLGLRPRNLNEPRELARFLKSTETHPLRYHIHTLILRSLKRALYSAEAHGHFGLALTYYSHFTSPIRRYPDLIMHRQLADYINHTGHGGALDSAFLIKAAAQATDREMVADEAERTLTEIKKFRFLQQQLDERKPQEYEAVIVSVKSFGFFVEVIDLQLSGMVPISTISRSYVLFDASTETMSVGNVRFKTGMDVKVFVTKVDFPARRLDFAYVKGSAVDKWNPPPPKFEHQRVKRDARKAPRDRAERPARMGRTKGERSARTERPTRATSSQRGTATPRPANKRSSGAPRNNSKGRRG